MKRILVAFLVLMFPLSTLAGEPSLDATPATAVPRRGGFLQIWHSIQRPAEPAMTRFTDVPEPARGSLEIDYAASRHIIDDKEVFRPDDPLLLRQALIWLLRVRNVADDPAEVNASTIGEWLVKYPIAQLPQEKAEIATITSAELSRVIALLDTQLAEEQHEVSLYAEKWHGEGTAFGEKFDMYAMTAAHRSFPYNTLVKVTNVRNGKSVIVRINDRGPYVKGRDMDLSLAAFTSIEDRSKGKFMATFQRLGDVRLVEPETAATKDRDVPSCNVESVMQRRIGGGLALTHGIPVQLSLGSSLTLDGKKPFVIRSIRLPDGSVNRLQDFVMKGEEFSYAPSIEGEYLIKIGTINGRLRNVKMNVVGC